ncbi:hypothetical protein EC844_101318 [Acinetobacter calcoaceticus]|uniref:Uncharacterized protein n=1 Tax=Acinetobacter calcoaceticus TaxID=471 RepID=A0A4R1Y1N3_ACICA|nr:hypothetical protein EC844_101318 [Acinetobacter calcoaceticus]
MHCHGLFSICFQASYLAVIRYHSSFKILKTSSLFATSKPLINSYNLAFLGQS